MTKRVKELPRALTCAECGFFFDRDKVISWKRDWIPKTLLTENGAWSGGNRIICVFCTKVLREQFDLSRTMPKGAINCKKCENSKISGEAGEQLPGTMTCKICKHIFPRFWAKSWKGEWIYNDEWIICVKCNKKKCAFWDKKEDGDEKEDVELTQIF